MTHPALSALSSLIYVSAATSPFGPEESESLLVEASLSNLASTTTGVLLYSGGSFMGYLESDRDTLSATYDRIKGSRRHTGIMELLEEPIADRLFYDWLFACADPSPSDLVRLSTARWKRLLRDQDRRQGMPAALEVLQQFWINAR